MRIPRRSGKPVAKRSTVVPFCYIYLVMGSLIRKTTNAPAASTARPPPPLTATIVNPQDNALNPKPQWLLGEPRSASVVSSVCFPIRAWHPTEQPMAFKMG